MLSEAEGCDTLIAENKGEGDRLDYERKYLELLSKRYPNVQTASTKLINLSAVLNLPKGTEHFIADIHGEYDAFNHFLKNASGIIRQKINDRFHEWSEEERRRLAFFIYYPTDMIDKYQRRMTNGEFDSLVRKTIKGMVELARMLVTKYTKQYVIGILPGEFKSIIEELLYESEDHEDKKHYYDAILDAAFRTERDRKLLVELSRFIRHLAVDRLHVVGDIFDRGPKPHLVMERIMRQRQVDIQWGNHDIIWMGAASGCKVCIANVIRIAARYNNLDCLEDGYGINLRLLAAFANKTYKNDPCRAFYPKAKTKIALDESDNKFVARMHKAITIIQFKLEREVIARNPDFDLADRLLLEEIDHEKGTIEIDGTSYELADKNFPTVDPEDPYALTEEEARIINHLTQLFLHNEMLQKHVRFLFRKGSIVHKTNDVLLFHAGIPMNEDGSFMVQRIDGKDYKGKALIDRYEMKIRNAYLNRYKKKNPERDYFVMLWQGKTSPLFAKSAMKTFERYFIEDEKTHEETMNPYFTLREEQDTLERLFREFGIDPKKGKTINGHVPLDVTKGHDVVLADKRIYLIDGGMSKQYAKKTSIGGYTLISDSYSFHLVYHSRFSSYEELIEEEKDIVSVTHSEDIRERRTYIYDTDQGEELREEIEDLDKLIRNYREGVLKEQEPE